MIRFNAVPRLLAAALGLAAALPVVVLPLAAAAQEEPLRLEGLTDAGRAQLHGEIRAYLLENPEIILEVIQILEDRREQAAQSADADLIAANAEALFADPNSYVAGNPDGDVTIVEFLDYRCGFCKRVHPTVKQVLEADPNVRLVVKEFPILGPDSVTAGKMALAAFQIDPDKYGELNDALLSHPGNLTEVTAYRIAKDIGYDVGELKALAASDKIDTVLQANFALAQALNLSGTPSFVIGDQVVRGLMQFEEMMATVEAARETAAN
ncbi:MAG: DsbA family protein [Paracoccaceae bacterium]